MLFWFKFKPGHSLRDVELVMSVLVSVACFAANLTHPPFNEPFVFYNITPELEKCQQLVLLFL